MSIVKCTNCGCDMEFKSMICSSCGLDGTRPKTIEQLKIWYREMNLPSEEVTRFFIDRDVSVPRAFGIYKEGDRFIVYKNKSDGVRVVRYYGFDEEYAVNELYLRLNEEIVNQKDKFSIRTFIPNSNSSNYSYNTSYSDEIESYSFIFIFVLKMLLVGLIIKLLVSAYMSYVPNQTFYKYDNNIYYYCKNIDNKYGDLGDSGWYRYDAITSSWYYFCDIYSTYLISEEFEKNPRSYYIGTVFDYYRGLSDEYNINNDYYDDSYNYYNLYDSSDSYSSYNSYSGFDSGTSYDSGTGYDSGGSYSSNGYSWDSSYTNWDSDW